MSGYFVERRCRRLSHRWAFVCGQCSLGKHTPAVCMYVPGILVHILLVWYRLAGDASVVLDTLRFD